MIDISFKNRTGIKPETLSAVIGSDSFFYGLFSDDFQLLECQYYQVADFSDKELIEKVKFDLFNTKHLTIKVTSTSKPFMHSKYEDRGKLLSFFPAFHNKTILDDKFTDQDVAVDYGLTKQQEQFLDKVFNEKGTRFHISTVLSNYYYPFSKRQLIAFIDDDSVHLLFGKDMQFVYYNQFECTHENDFLYFIGLVYDELSLNKEEDVLHLFGRVDIDSPIYKLLFGYIRHIEFMKSERLVVTDLRFRAKQHYYLDLFATALCE